MISYMIDFLTFHYRLHVRGNVSSISICQSPILSHLLCTDVSFHLDLGFLLDGFPSSSFRQVFWRFVFNLFL